MSVIQRSPFSVMDRFPEHAVEARRLFKEDENFRILCEDYRRCREALHFWIGFIGGETGRTEAKDRRKEYTELQQDLEAEILQQLSTARRRGGPGSAGGAPGGES